MIVFCFLFFDTHATQKVAGDDMETRSTGNGASCSLITHTANEAVTLHQHIDMLGDKQFDTAQKGVDIYFLVLADDGFTQVQAQTAAKGVQPGAMKGFAPIAVFVGTKAHGTTDALAVLALRHRTLEPLRRILVKTVNDEFSTNVQQENGTEIFRPGMLPIQLDDTPHVGQPQQGSDNKNDTDNCSACHNRIV